MPTTSRRISLERAVASIALAASLCVGSPVPPAHGQSAAELAQLDRLRAGLQKYQDPVVAIHDGYFSTLGCVVIAQPGGPGEVPYEPGGWACTS